MFTRDELEALRNMGFDNNAWYTKSGQKAAEKGAEDAYNQSKE